MRAYLGETKADIKHSPFANYTPADWACLYHFQYGQIDGDHHKTWVLDQIVRILKGTPVEINLAKWSDGEIEYRFSTGEPSQEYLNFVKDYCDNGQYSYDEGCPP